MSSEKLQQTINQLSLMMNVDADVSRAIKDASIHPALGEVLLKMHATQVDFNNELLAMRKAVTMVVQSIDMMANNTMATKLALSHLANVNNVRFEDLFTTAEPPAEDNNNA